MTSQEYADEIAAKERIIEEIRKQKRQLRENWIKYHCPIKIGDVVTGNDYSYEGSQMIVEEIGVTDGIAHGVPWDIRWKWVAVGPVLNKNGLPSKRFTKYTEAVKGIKEK